MSDDSDLTADGAGELTTDFDGAPSVTTTDGTFYVVPSGPDHELFADELAAIEAFGEHIDDREDVTDEDQIREIEIGEAGDDWIIRRLTWQDVARRLLEQR